MEVSLYAKILRTTAKTPCPNKHTESRGIRMAHAVQIDMASTIVAKTLKNRGKQSSRGIASSWRDSSVKRFLLQDFGPEIGDGRLPQGGPIP